MTTAIVYYHNGKLIPNTIALTTANEESSVRKMSCPIMSFNVLEKKLGIQHSRMYQTPYEATEFKHLTRTPEWEQYFFMVEAMQNINGLTDIFIVQCSKNPIPLSDDNLIIDDGRTEYYVGFLMVDYEDLETFINFHIGEGWKRDEVIEAIKRFLAYDYSGIKYFPGCDNSHYFLKLRRVAAANLELLGLESLPELIMGSDNDNSIAA